jgi:hypothetical protein
MKRIQQAMLCLFVIFALFGFVLQMGCDQLQNLVQDAGQPTKGTTYTPAQIERGKYLVEEVATCGPGCHTPIGPTGPDPNRILAGGEEFIPGALWTPNITPDPETGIGNYTDAQIALAITRGIGHFDKNPQGSPLHPIMPYWQFANLTTEDVISIIAFLRKGVKPVKNRVQERAPFIVPPRPAPPLNYSSLPGDNDDPGKYLTSAASGCLNCHTARLENGALDPTKYFAGGDEFPIPGLKVFSANITPHPKTGIGTWTRKEIVTAIREGSNPDGIPLCPPMFQFRGITESDMNDIVNFLINLPAIDNFVEPCEIEAQGPPPQ